MGRTQLLTLNFVVCSPKVEGGALEWTLGQRRFNIAREVNTPFFSFGYPEEARASIAF
jgi:hypothetical protein